MRILDILTRDQVSVSNEREGLVRNKAEALARLAELLTQPQKEVGEADIEHVLAERERLQSTGVGGGVAIPHGSIDRLGKTFGALLVCPDPIAFDAIDGRPVGIVFGVVGPRGATGAHLKTLARVSRLLRDEAFRERLLTTSTGAAAYDLVAAEEERSG